MSCSCTKADLTQMGIHQDNAKDGVTLTIPNTPMPTEESAHILTHGYLDNLPGKVVVFGCEEHVHELERLVALGRSHDKK